MVHVKPLTPSLVQSSSTNGAVAVVSLVEPLPEPLDDAAGTPWLEKRPGLHSRPWFRSALLIEKPQMSVAVVAALRFQGDRQKF